jgi:hypothetical protein
MGEEIKVYKVLVVNPEGRRPLGRPRRRWEDGFGMYLREIGLGGVDWIRLSQDRDPWRAVASAVMNLRVLLVFLGNRTNLKVIINSFYEIQSYPSTTGVWPALLVL